MHELSLASEVVELAAEELRGRGLSAPATKVTLRAGVLLALVPESFRFFFDQLKADHAQLAACELEILVDPAEATCRSCGATTPLSEPVFLCPSCGGTLTTAGGRDLFLQSIEVEEA